MLRGRVPRLGWAPASALIEEPVLQQGRVARVDAAPQVPGVGVDVGLFEEALQGLADQLFIGAEGVGHRGRRCALSGLLRRRCVVCRLIEGGGLHHHRLHHQLQVFHALHQVLQGAAQVLLEALHAAGDGVGLAGEVGLQFGLELLLAGAEGVDLRFQGIAA